MFRMVPLFVLSVLAAGAFAIASPQQAPAPPHTCPELATAMTSLMRNDARLRDWANLAKGSCCGLPHG